MTDHLGTPRIVLDQTGSLANVSLHDYLPFGEEVPANFRSGIPGYGTADNVRQKFTQKERDNETGLDYFGARYYANSQGRFNEADPAVLRMNHLANPQDLNRYSYVANNPLAFIDPNGEEKIRITVRAFIPNNTKWGYAGDGHAAGEKVGARDGFRIRQTIIVETNPSRGSAIVLGSTRSETGVSFGPNLVNPNRFGQPDWDQAACNNCEMTAVRTEQAGVSVNFSADVSNPLHPSLFASINYSLDVTATPSTDLGSNDIIASVAGNHTRFPAFDVTMERIEQPNSAPVVVYNYDPYVNPYNSGSSPFSLSPIASQNEVTDAETLTRIPPKEPR